MRALDEPLGDDRQEQESHVTSGQTINETIVRPHCLVTAEKFGPSSTKNLENSCKNDTKTRKYALQEDTR